MAICTQRSCIPFEQGFYSIIRKEKLSNIIWRWWRYHRACNFSYLLLPMFCITCTAAIWDQYMLKMGAMVMTWDLRWKFTSSCRNSSTCSKYKNSPHITSVSYFIWRFIHNSSIYEQNPATSKLGWDRWKIMRASNRREIQSGEDLALSRGRSRWQRFYPRTQSNLISSI